MSISNLIVSLDVEKKVWAKDGQSKGVEGQTSANMVHQPLSCGKDKGKQNKNNNKPKQNTIFKKKKNKKQDEGCFVCGSPDHWAKKCPNHKGRKPQPERETVNIMTNTRDGTSWYGNLPSVLSVFQSTTWWLDSSTNIHVCSYTSLFSSYQVTRDSSMMMGNGHVIMFMVLV
jgi:hypothetical protein